jgi:hypothetical protein
MLDAGSYAVPLINRRLVRVGSGGVWRRFGAVTTRWALLAKDYLNQVAKLRFSHRAKRGRIKVASLARL